MIRRPPRKACGFRTEKSVEILSRCLFINPWAAIFDVRETAQGQFLRSGQGLGTVSNPWWVASGCAMRV